METKTKAVELTPEEHRLLEAGLLTMNPWTNRAQGTRGYLILNMKRRGLLQSREVRTGPLQSECVEHYWPTKRGRDAYVSYGAPLVPITASSER